MTEVFCIITQADREAAANHHDRFCGAFSPPKTACRCGVEEAFARHRTTRPDATPVAWMPIDSAPKGVPTKDVGCRGESEWFLGKPSGKYPQSAPFVAICRRAWPQDDSWKDAGDTHYRPDYFSEWCPIETSHPPATDVAELVDAAKAFQHYGCPVCSGDCGSANPPVMACPMQALSAALAPFTKGQNDG